MTISKFLAAAFAAATLSLFGPAPTHGTGEAFADAGGACHFHGKKQASEEVVLDCAAKRKQKLISSNKIDAGWKDIKHEKAEQVEGKKGKEWLVTFKDPAAKEKSKETLYIYFSLSGNFIAANFTGK